MNLSAIRVLWLLTGVLGAAIAVELVLPNGVPKTATQPNQSGSVAARPGTEPMAAWSAAILARPLFNPNRRPRAIATPGAAGGPAEPPRLSGIMITPDGGRAIFAGESEERPIVVARGARVGRWEILDIAAEQVRLSGPDGELTIRPRYVNGPAAPLPAVIKSQSQPASLLPLLPRTATQPLESAEQPSGASIFSNAQLQSAIRKSH